MFSWSVFLPVMKDYSEKDVEMCEEFNSDMDAIKYLLLFTILLAIYDWKLQPIKKSYVADALFR